MTGGTGFLGVHVVRALTQAGASVSVLARPKSDRSRLEFAKPRWVEGDLDSVRALSELARGASAFVHVAGVIRAPNPWQYNQVNIEGTRCAVQAAVRERVETFVLISSLAAAGPTQPGLCPRKEEEPPTPRSHYGRSKLGAEEVVEREGSSLKHRVILRPGAIYGPYDRAFLLYFRLQAKGLRVVLGRGQRIFQPVFAGDVADACLAAVTARPANVHAPSHVGEGREGSRSYFLVGREAVTWEEFGLQLGQVIGRSAFCVRLPEFLAQPRLLSFWPPLRPVIDRLTDVLAPRWEADTSRAEAELGWSARTPLKEGLRQTWEWYRQQGWL